MNFTFHKYFYVNLPILEINFFVTKINSSFFHSVIQKVFAEWLPWTTYSLDFGNTQNEQQLWREHYG